MTIPWMGLLKGAANILAAASGLKELWTSSTDSTQQLMSSDAALARRVLELEAREVQQARLIEEMALQISSLTTALQVLSRRLLAAVWVGVTALALAAVALLLALRQGM